MFQQHSFYAWLNCSKTTCNVENWIKTIHNFYAIEANHRISFLIHCSREICKQIWWIIEFKTSTDYQILCGFDCSCAQQPAVKSFQHNRVHMLGNEMPQFHLLVPASVRLSPTPAVDWAVKLGYASHENTSKAVKRNRTRFTGRVRREISNKILTLLPLGFCSASRHRVNHVPSSTYIANSKGVLTNCIKVTIANCMRNDNSSLQCFNSVK